MTELSFLNPVIQESFWSNLAPDLRAAFSAFENKEDWTHSYESLPFLFNTLASALPNFSKTPTKERAPTVERLVPLLVAMPFRECVSTVAWLENCESNTAVAWGAACFLEAAGYASDPTNPLFSEGRNLCERIKLATNSEMAATLFSELSKIVENNENK